ncbi:hypothetical protein [Actinocorallia longicatena]|uniref:Integral membrane protein n=1 Tax=Actinocorallia longicatena TaxID=111803 RepID=A0ABP6QG43_9ACTN
MRRILSVVLIVLGCLLAPVALTAVWAANQVSDTDRYLKTVAPLADDPAIQNAVADRVTTAVMSRLDIPSLVSGASESLPPRVGQLAGLVAGPASSLVQGFVRDKSGAVVASDAFATIWTEANRVAHTRIDKILAGDDDTVVQTDGDTVNVELGPVVQTVKERLVAEGMTVAGKIPDINPTYPLFKTDQLAQAQTYYDWLGVLEWLAPLLALACLAGGVLLARGRRKALGRAALGVGASMLVLAVGLMISRSAVVGAAQNAEAGGALFDIVVDLLRLGLRAVLLLSLAVAVGAWLAGGSATAVRTRAYWTDLLRGRADTPVTAWVTAHRSALRIGAVALAVLAFVFWPHPTGLVVLCLIVALLVVLAVIELLTERTPAAPSPQH